MVTSDVRWKTWLNVFFGLGLTFLFFYMMAPFVVAFLLGAVIAIIASPLFEATRKKTPPGVAALLTTMAITLLILVPFGLLLFSGSHRLLRLIGDLRASNTPLSLSGLEQATWLRNLANWVSRYVDLDREWVRDQAKDVLMSGGEALSKMIASSLAAMPSFVLAFFVVIISVFFLLKDGARFLEFLESLSPAPNTRSRELFRAFETSCRGVVLSLLASAVVQGGIMMVFALITGMKNSPMLGMLTIIFGMVPIVGAAPVWIGATIYLFVQGSSGYGIVMLIGGVLISTSDNIVRPLILRGHSQMHPLLALVSVFGAVNLVGAPGIFLGPIIAAVFVSFLKILSMENQREREGPAVVPPSPSGGTLV
jgi:predicted PurR-regulated permease PerM